MPEKPKFRTACFLCALSMLFVCVPLTSAKKPQIALDETERSWLREHPAIRLGVGVAFPPFMWVEKKDGRDTLKGMVSDYVKLLAERLDVDMQPVLDIPFDEALSRGRAGEIDFFPCLSNTPERNDFLLFTPPYLSYPMVILTREDAPIIGGVPDLKGKRLAVVEHLVVYSKLRNDYPDLDLEFIFTRKVDENLDAVSLGRADACIINLAVAGYYIQQKGLTNLKIAAPVDWEGVHLSMGIRKDWPVFERIIEKAMASISQEEKDRISRRWIRVEFDTVLYGPLFRRWALGLGLGGALMFTLFFMWNRRLRKEILDKEAAESALRESEEKLRNIVENSTNLFYAHTVDHQIIYISPQCREFLQCEPEEAMVLWTAFATDNPINQRGLELTETAIKTGIRQQPYELELVGKKGRKIVVEVREAPIQKDVRTVAIVGSLTDVTHRKKTEQEKARLQLQLLQSQKVEAIGTLAGRIAHDFNNILSAIIGYTELALDDTPAGSPLENSLKEVYTAGMRARDLVKQILAFARQSDEERKPIQVGAIAKEVMKLIRSTTPSTIEIRENMASRSLVTGNPSQVHQLFMNLCTNAAQAMEDAGGVLEVGLTDVGSEDPSLPRLGLKPGSYVKITVSDTGPGIPPHIIGSIFEPYFTTKGVGEGTGMGLALVHGIVASYGGKITVESEPDRGAIFSVYLPGTKKRDAHGPREEERLPSGTERILFVDDELPIARMSSQILERLGYRVTVRTDSVEALALFRSGPDAFDLVISDMTMPNMTGDELTMALIAIRPDIPVILCTGYSKKISDDTAAKIGIRAFAYKPIVKADLAKTIRKVLDASGGGTSGSAAPSSSASFPPPPQRNIGLVS